MEEMVIERLEKQMKINKEFQERINVLYYLFGILLFLWLFLVGFITYLVFL